MGVGGFYCSVVNLFMVILMDDYDGKDGILRSPRSTMHRECKLP